MRRIIIALAFAAGAWAGPAQGEPRDVSAFTRVDAAGQFRVEVTHGLGFAVDVSGAEAERITTAREGRTLQIRSTARQWWGGERRTEAVVRVTMPGVEALSASRGVTMTAQDVNAGALTLEAARGAHLSIAGICERLDADATMGAFLDAENMDCGSANVSASMGAQAKVRAREAVEAEASMGANVRVAGAPAQQTISASMGGDVRIQ